MPEPCDLEGELAVKKLKICNSPLIDQFIEPLNYGRYKACSEIHRLIISVLSNGSQQR